MVCDTGLLLNQALDRGETVLLEAGQATLLDVDHGTYPFVTSSSATAGGACTGSGIPPTRLDRVIGIVKAYTTRVGEGPFPTELHDDFGEHLRKIGAEYGTTTGRPRRCGWYDAVIARYAARVNGVTDFVLTKLDVLTGLEKVPVCVAYDVDGVRHDEMPVNQSDFHHAVPIYEELPGWWEDISEARTLDDLPRQRPRLRQRGRGDVRRADLGDRRRPGARRRRSSSTTCSRPRSPPGVAVWHVRRAGRRLARSPGQSGRLHGEVFLEVQARNPGRARRAGSRRDGAGRPRGHRQADPPGRLRHGAAATPAPAATTSSWPRASTCGPTSDTGHRTRSRSTSVTGDARRPRSPRVVRHANQPGAQAGGRHRPHDRRPLRRRRARRRAGLRAATGRPSTTAPSRGGRRSPLREHSAAPTARTGSAPWLSGRPRLTRTLAYAGGSRSAAASRATACSGR